MARRRTIIKSLAFPLDKGNRDELFEQSLAGLFDEMGRRIVDEFSLPVEIELSFHREHWDGWIEASLAGLLLPKRGRGYRDGHWGKDDD